MVSGYQLAARGVMDLMELDELQDRFAIPGVLEFKQTDSGLVAVQVTTPAADATIYTQGAHLAHWKPAGQTPVIFLSKRAEFARGKAIRGGVPVIFPWFGERHDGNAGPQHGFARTAEWELASAMMAGEGLHLLWTLEPDNVSRGLGFDHFRVAYRMTIARTLTLELTVANDVDAAAPLLFEEALHTYYAVADARKVSITGLGGTAYIDKVDGAAHKVQPPGPLLFSGRTDRPYLNTEATCVLRDDAAGRQITVAKAGSKTTVVWNPWQELTATMRDMEPDGWLHMMCVETANAGEDAVTLAPGRTHTMRVEISVEALA